MVATQKPGQPQTTDVSDAEAQLAFQHLFANAKNSIPSLDQKDIRDGIKYALAQFMAGRMQFIPKDVGQSVPAEPVNTALATALQAMLDMPNDDSPESTAKRILSVGRAQRLLNALSSTKAAPSQPDMGNPISVAVPVLGLESYPCEIEEADFEANTVTLKILSKDFQVHAGEYRLIAAPHQQQEV